ncbi:MAG: hypothetical protein PUE60_05605 [Eubacteriales bacterium]|nr:hypothetical protein [Eubacteriales bacterium]
MMKTFIKNLLLYLKIKRILKKEFELMTQSLDFVNLDLKPHFMKGYEIYNNSDLLASLSVEEINGILVLGIQFFRSLLYSLCIKYSIEKIW